MNERRNLNVGLAELMPVPARPQVAVEQLLQRRVTARNSVLFHLDQPGCDPRANLPNVVRAERRGAVTDATARDMQAEERFARL